MTDSGTTGGRRPVGTFAAGEIAVYRHVWHGKPQIALPARVVADDGDRVALYVAPGTKGWFTAADSPADILRTLWEPTWTLAERRYETPGVGGLHLLEAGVPFEIRLMFDPTGRLDYWYGNLQEPYRRTAVGFDTTDHVLDLVIDADLAGYRWKDRDEFATARRHGVYDDAKAAAIVAAGEAVLDRWRARAHPFDGTWTDWRPDLDLPPVSLPADWTADVARP